MRASIVGLTVLVAAASPAIAQSKQDKEKARAFYESGLKHYNLAEHPEAIKNWKEAYSLTKKPLLLFNIGQAYRLSGDCKLAGTFYDSYQREEPNPKNQDELDQALALCASGGTKPVDTKPVDTKPVDTKPVDTKPVDTKPVDTKPVDTNPTVVGQTGGAETGGEVDQPEPVETSSSGGLRKIGIGVAAAGVVAGGVAIYFALDSASIASDLEKHTGEWEQPQIDLEAKGESRATLGWVMGGIGIAAIAAGGVMIAIGGPKAAESSTVGVLPTRGGAAVGWSFRF